MPLTTCMIFPFTFDYRCNPDAFLSLWLYKIILLPMPDFHNSGFQPIYDDHMTSDDISMSLCTGFLNTLNWKKIKTFKLQILTCDIVFPEDI